MSEVTLYVTDQGLKINKDHGRIVLTKSGKVVEEIPLFKIERILIFGNIQITTQAMSSFLEQGIIVSFFTANGKFKGMLRPVESGNVFLRIAQYERYFDKSFRLAIAKSFVSAKIKNMLTLLKLISKNHKEFCYDEKVLQMQEILNGIEKVDTIPQLLGLEGISTSTYFNCISSIVKGKFNFTSRTHHPPKDPFNALLSFGYALLTNEIFAVLSGFGFDPYIGFYHELSYARPSLATDLIEEFRAPIVDHLILDIVNLKIIKETDFEEKENSFFLNDNAKKEFFIRYNKTINEFRDSIKEQVQKMYHSILEGVNYEPFLWRV
jgi:CRISPR-associated protein Cas1